MIKAKLIQNMKSAHAKILSACRLIDSQSSPTAKQRIFILFGVELQVFNFNKCPKQLLIESVVFN